MKTILIVHALLFISFSFGQDYNVTVQLPEELKDNTIILSATAHRGAYKSYFLSPNGQGGFYGNLPRGNYLFEIKYSNQLVKVRTIEWEVNSDTTITIAFN